MQADINAQLQRAPAGAQISANQVSYDGGHVLVTFVPASIGTARPNNSGPCPSGWFCVWNQTNQGGNRYQWQQTGFFQNFSDYGVSYVDTLYNNRSARMFLHQGKNGGNPEICYSPGTYIGNVGPWEDYPGSLYLATSSGC